MESARTSKEIIKEFVETNMSTHTDWTGTRVETKYECESIEKFIDKLWDYIEPCRRSDSSLRTYR